MKIVEQRSDRDRGWYDAEIVQDGTVLQIPATTFWLRNVGYELAAYAPDVGEGAFRILVEKTEAGADYLLDLTGEAEPESFGEGIGAFLLAWRVVGAELSVLRSVT